MAQHRSKSDSEASSIAVSGHSEGDTAPGDAFDDLLREAVRLHRPGSEIDVHRLAIPRKGDVIADKYVLDERLGAGGMGIVFRARHRVTGKAVAIKWMLPAASSAGQRRFVREAQAVGMIDHANVVDIYDMGEHAGGTYLVMELLRGRPFRSLLHGGRQLAPRELVNLMIPALRGLSQAHRVGVIHRDLKPENLFLCEPHAGNTETLKVLDFGVSKIVDNSVLDPTVTRTGTTLGTPAYMSPEQLADSTDVDVRTDVYAVGVMMYEALAGRRPFDASSHNAVVMAVAEYRPTPIHQLRTDVPPELERVVMKAMAKDREDRYADARELLDALGPFASESRVSNDRAVPGKRLAAVAGVAALGIGATWGALHPGDPSAENRRGASTPELAVTARAARSVPSALLPASGSSTVPQSDPVRPKGAAPGAEPAVGTKPTTRQVEPASRESPAPRPPARPVATSAAGSHGASMPEPHAPASSAKPSAVGSSPLPSAIAIPSTTAVPPQPPAPRAGEISRDDF